MFGLADALTLLSKVGPIVAKLPEFKRTFDQAVSTLHPADQESAKRGYQELIKENAEGHARLHEMLVEAAKR